ncbi:MAG: CCA tRNA nucleotidyltransferase [Xanthobacteraceae bacterium]|nr:CCA tRNA nucleotidyltransferase [Xanthobacteraceae bacterium]
MSARRLVHAAWLREGALAALLDALDRDGEEARVVGGAVRNTLMGLPHGDIDVATTALPAEVTRRVAARGFKAVPTGVDHGTVTVVVEGTPFEVTTLREDVETFGRKATVRFGRDWVRDAERRDFTMNALSVTRDGTVHDHVGGLADLAARRVRFIGDPARRIAEDYLRILRFFRFHAAYGHGAPDAEGLHACIVARAGLAQLSRERVRMELMKLLAAPGAAATLGVMADSGLIGPVLAGVPWIASFDGLVAREAALGLAGDPVRRLGALAVMVAEDAERLWQRLRLFNVEHARLSSMAEGWWRVSPEAGEGAARALLYRLEPERFSDRALIAWARSGADVDDAGWRALATLPARWTAPAFPLKASHLMKRGLARGPALGAALKAAEAAWITAGFPNDRAALAAIADAAAAEVRAGS